MHICNIHTVSPIVQPLEPVKQISLVANLGCEDFASWNGSERRWLVRSLGTDFSWELFVTQLQFSVPNFFIKVWTIVVGKFFVGHLLVHQESQFRRCFLQNHLGSENRPQWAKIWVHGFILISLLNRQPPGRQKNDDCHQDDRDWGRKHISWEAYPTVETNAQTCFLFVSGKPCKDRINTSQQEICNLELALKLWKSC